MIADTRNTEALILRRLATVKNQVVGEAIGHDDSHVSRIAANERGIRLRELEAFFKALGLRVIECDGATVTLPADELDALKLFARKGLSQ